ncbi:MAG: DNA polymerase III, subunit gamma and tau [Crocinitomicaceae bacterium]|nr:DNA polymerase III, subunit gamma and tau [Crocinitomicaceae bacterium]
MSNSNYTVSALKYRPNSWDTIIGQENIAITLKQAIVSNQLAQAYLFCGPRGVGKTSTARLFAKSINLKHDPKLTDFTYNIFELDAASNNQVDDIRNLNDQIRIPPQRGNYKVYVIDEVHMLSQSAFNAFLKTLEEPPPHAIFILATTEKHKIIPTILSRCQVYDFHRISISDMVAHLENIANKEGVNSEPEALHVIAEKADGALRDALSCFDLMVNFTNRNITYKEVVKNLNILDHDYYFKFADFIHKNLIHESLLLFNEIISKGFDGRLFVNGLASHFRNLMIAKDERTLKILEYTKNTIEKFKTQAELFDNEYLTDLLSLTNEADSFYKTSQNQRLLVEILIMKLCSCGAEKKKLNFLDATIIAPNFKDSKLIYSSKDVENQPLKEIEPIEKQPHPKTYGPEKSEIIRPKTSLSIKKRSVAASITGIRQQINQELTAKNEDGGVEVLVSSKFSQKQLEEKWNEFAEIKNKEGKIGLFTTLSKQTPELLDDFLIKFILDSEVQKMEFQTQNQLLLDFLRAELKNSHIQLVLELSKSDNPKLTQLTSKERFFQMAEKNPDLHIFKEKFNLDLEL